ncbi:hypothetical protein RGJ20_000983 [Serratia marcescens]
MTLTTDRFNEIYENPEQCSYSEIQEMAAMLANREAQPVALNGWLVTVSRTGDRQGVASISGPGVFCMNVPVKYSMLDFMEALSAPPAPANAVAWEMRYWNSGYNIWGEWERITAEQHAEMSAEHAADNDYEFRVLAELK